MKWYEKIWQKISGSKTYIGIGLHISWFALNLFKKDLTDNRAYWEGHAYIGAITGVGVGHKLTKSEKVKDAINKGVESSKKIFKKK